MHKICDALELPAAFKHKNPGEHLQYNLARASVSAVLNMSINGQDADKAILSGLADAAVSTAAGITAQHIGDMYLGQKMSSVTHKVTHMAVGAASGAVLGGKKGALAGAIGAGVAEVVAEALQPELPLEALNAQLKSAETEKGRTLTFEEYQEVRARVMSEASLRDYQQEVTKTANYAKIAAATASLLAHQDVGVAAQTASTALENNFMVSSIAAIALTQTEYFDYLGEARLQKTVEDELVDVESAEASIGLPGEGGEPARELPVEQEGSGLVDDSEYGMGYAQELPEVELGELPSVPATAASRDEPRESSSFSEKTSPATLQQPTKYSREQTAECNMQQPIEYSMGQWLNLAKRAFVGEKSPEVIAWQRHNRESMPTTATFFAGASNTRSTVNKLVAERKEALSKPVDSSNQQISQRLAALDLSGLERARLTVTKTGLTMASLAIDIFVPGSMEQVAVDLLAVATGAKCAQTAHRIAKARKIGGSLQAGARTIGTIPGKSSAATLAAKATAAMRGSATTADTMKMFGLATAGTVGVGLMAANNGRQTQISPSGTDRQSTSISAHAERRVNNAELRAATLQQEHYSYVDAEIELGELPPLRHPVVDTTIPGYPEQADLVGPSRESFPIHDMEETRFETPAVPPSVADSIIAGPAAEPALQEMWGLFRKKGGNTDRPHMPDRDKKYISPPKVMELAKEKKFAGVVKSNRRYNGRPSFKLPDGRIMTWDRQHGELEMHNNRGEHTGVYNLQGEQIKKAVPGRRINVK